ncbi:MAG TPA: DsbA family protein [Flavitalea sp.]|nr:DsbA family protein [Flavitalea sp.]
MAPGQSQPGTENNQPYRDTKADGVDITYYTDPLCCWSWAFEPQWRKLLFEYGDKISYRYCMGGLLPGWKNFHDPVNSVSRPIQMGPVWMHAAQLSGMPIQHNIWMKDPPASSYPACIAVKCAGLQSFHAGDRCLRLLREEVMIKGNNVARQEVLIEVARELKKELPLFDLKIFEEDLHHDRGLDAFKQDMQQVRYHEINRFPTLIIRRPQQSSMIITGHRPYVVLTEALNKIYPGITKCRVAETIEEYASYWPHVLPREIDEILCKG